MTLESPTSELIVALDVPRADRAIELVDQLDHLPIIFKIGSELFMSAGPEIVRELVHRKKRVFLDLKFHDVPNTVSRAIRQASLLHVEMVSLHLAGGSGMVRSVKKVLDDIPALRPKLIGVTVLASFDDVRWAEVTRSLTGHAVEVATSVTNLLEQAVAWGVDGIVCSAFEVGEIRRRFPLLYTIVPGIRFDSLQAHSEVSSADLVRVTTPRIARQAGAHAIVVGRSILESRNPAQTAEWILSDLGWQSESLRPVISL